MCTTANWSSTVNPMLPQSQRIAKSRRNALVGPERVFTGLIGCAKTQVVNPAVFATEGTFDSMKPSKASAIWCHDILPSAGACSQSPTVKA